MINSILVLGIAGSFMLVIYDFLFIRKKSSSFEKQKKELKEKDEEIQAYREIIFEKNDELQEIDYKHYKLKMQMIEMNYKNEELQSEIRYLKSTRTSVKKFEDIELLKKAVRKAMIYSHPDKTGTDSTEEFVAYKSLYDKLRK